MNELETYEMKDNIILLGQDGSYAYGTETEGSDKDFRGVFIPPTKALLGLQKPISLKNKNAFPEKKNEFVDYSIDDIASFFRSCKKGRINTVQLLFLEKDQYILVTEAGQKIIDNRELFLSKDMYPHLTGYAHSEMALFRNKTFSQKTRCKSATNAIRLLTLTTHLFMTGSFLTKRNREELVLLRAILDGNFNDEDLEALYNYSSEIALAAYEATRVKEKVDENAIDTLYTSIVLDSIKKELLEKGE